MTAKRWDGAAYQDIVTRKRWDGSSWVDITIAKRWDGAAWQDIIFAGGGGGGSLSVTLNKAGVSGDAFLPEPAPTTQTLTTDSVTATAAGGTGGPYTYAWTRLSGSSAISANSPSAATTTFTAICNKNIAREGVWRVTASDGVLSATADVNVSLLYETDL